MDRLIVDDVIRGLSTLPAESVDCCVTSPPYWGLRDYGIEGQIGHEATHLEYVAKMVEVFRLIRCVLKPQGTLWVNLGDAYAGSWGAQSRGNVTGEPTSTLTGTSPLSARQIAGGCKGEGQGSSKRTPGLKPKDLIGLPWRVALALQDDGWWLRSDIIWSKRNPMPESVTDRPTKAHEYLFLLTKSETYFYNADAIREPSTTTRPELLEFGSRPDVGFPGRMQDRKRASAKRGDFKGKTGDAAFRTVTETRNARSVWEIATQPYPEAHFATFPEELPRRCILAGCPEGGVVLDPFAGSGTTLAVAKKLGRHFIGIELNPAYAVLAERRIADITGSLFCI